MSLWERFKTYLKAGEKNYYDFTSDRGTINSYLIRKARGEGGKGDKKLNRIINRHRKSLARQRAAVKGAVIPIRRKNGTHQ